MAFCRNCGSELAEGTRFCTNCGAAVDEGTNFTAVSSEKKSRIDKFSIFYGVILFLLALVDYYSDPPAWTILLSVLIIVGAVFCLSRKYKFKIFTIMALLIAVFCLCAGVSQGNRMGFFKVPSDDDYAGVVNEVVSGTVSEAIAEKTEPSVENKVEKETAAKQIDLGEQEKASVVEEQKNVSAAEAEEKESIAEEKEAAKPVDGVDPELKAFLDSYEAFMDEYVDFMKKYTDGSGDPLAMLTEYTQIMTKYEDFAKKADAYDTNEMSTEDAKYYLEVMNRCNQKMLEVY